ncbi:MAG: 50S ribosomal protein L1 [Candidatus Woesearchaeota archaeon]
MEKKEILESLKKARESKARKFKQKIDLVINLKDLDLKKPEHQVDFYAILPKDTGKKSKICALVTEEMVAPAKEACDNVVAEIDFPKYGASKKLARKLAKEYGYFIAQANIMTKVAAAFGRVLGPKGKMPNPKAGAVFPPNPQLIKPLADKMRKTIRVSAKLAPIVQCMVGTEEMKDEDIAENILYIHDQIIHHLPNEAANIRSVYVKLTMGNAVRVQ